MRSHTWRGSKGAVLLGSTEDRVARYLVDRTSHGRVAIRTVDLATALRLERSEAYRITARLRVLGLFGIQNDRGGTRGGRLVWRTPSTRVGSPRLDPLRHRVAWSRVLGAARHRAARVADFMRSRAPERTATSARPAPGPAGPSFREMFAAAPGGAQLLDLWGVT
jgi:hypothetical protein